MSSIIIGAGSSELASIPVFNINIGQSANVITILRHLIEILISRVGHDIRWITL